VSTDEEFVEKLRSLSFPRKVGTKKKKPVIDERDGSIGGYEIEHWDGSQDAHVLLKPVKSKARAQKEN